VIPIDFSRQTPIQNQALYFSPLSAEVYQQADRDAHRLQVMNTLCGVNIVQARADFSLLLCSTQPVDQQQTPRPERSCKRP
jgi:hypothetical protein